MRVRLFWGFLFSVLLMGTAFADELKEDSSKKTTILEQDMKIQALQKRVEALESAGVAEGEDPNTFRVYWKEGLRMDSADKNFKLKIGGRFMYDWFWGTADNEIEANLGKLEDGSEMRRARLYTSGTIYKNVDFKLQLDFAGGDADLKDAYLALPKLPFGTLKGGHWKEPFSLEELTSSKYITFMERSLPNLFAPARNAGFAWYDNWLEEELTAGVGLFRTVDDYGEGESDGGYAVTGRITGLPLYEEKGAKLVHLGAAATYRSVDDLRYRQRPEQHLAYRFVDTGTFAADNELKVVVEGALVLDSFSVQGEWFWVEVMDAMDSATLLEDDLNFTGYYVYVSYFVTGEHRAYKKKDAVFSRVKPKHNFMNDHGLGAVELAARYSFIDLNDGFIDTAGELADVTVGVNWHLNPNVRIMLNWVHAELDDRGYDGDADMVGLRLQVDF